MINYAQNLRAIKTELRKARNTQKEKLGIPFEQFYHETASKLRNEFHVQVSAGWVREQCTKDTDPSYMRIGAVLNFLEQYHGFKLIKKEVSSVADHGPRVVEDVAEEKDNELFNKLKAQVEAEKAKGKTREPNAWMKQIEAQKRAARAKSS